MIINCNKNELLNKINIVSKAVASKSTRPILECILICADSKGLRLTANNMDLGIETDNMKQSEIEEKGSIAVEAKLFVEIIRNMPDDFIKISTDENDRMTIKSGKSEFKILGLPGEDFPQIPVIEKSVKYETKANVLKNMIKQTIFAVAIDESKPVFTGELLEIKDNSLNIVAVDGFRVSFRKTAIENKNENVSVVIPAKTLNEISRILDEEDEIVSMYFNYNTVLFETEKFTMVSRLLEGDFLKYEQSFINEYNTAIEVDKNEFLSSIERATLVSKDSKKNPVQLNITDNNLAITSNTDIGTSYEEVSANTEGDDLKIGFNPKYLIDAMKAIDDERIVIKFMSDLSPCIIESIDNDYEKEDSYKYLVLPLRIRN